ncbi:hypothetical protein C8Q80DRAFT_1141673 [Daedaleopsis nitida]|nr:hypothetical protein C8Q80DRAFT_1141673 [Daedaleopsis nitida]
MSEPIIFYDIPGNAVDDKAWSPNTFKTRYCLNIKGIPYKTVWVEYPDIAGLCKKIGATCTSTKADGTSHFTLPAIYDPNTRTGISESAAIAQYLDKTYPSTYSVVPKGTEALHKAFTQALHDAILQDLLQMNLPPTCLQLNPPSSEYFRRTREATYGMKMEEFSPEGSEKRAKHWKRVEDGLRLVKGWMEAGGEGKLLVMGEQICYADITIASWLEWTRRVHGTNSQVWKDVMGWDGGFWAKFMKEFDKHGAVDVGSLYEA